MATSNKSKKILEKARKVAAKTKKKKVSKVDVKKKTTSFPEGQNAPQSKRYTQEADKSLGAKNTGWRWTKEGAKKLGKDANAKPSQSDIETYRNETFKLKGKPNKSGPKGVGDGSHRYLYIERRADKADIKRSQKLAHGGKVKGFGEVYNDVVNYISKHEKISKEKAQEIVEKKEAWLKDMVEYHEETNTKYLAEAITSDIDEYAKGGEVETALDKLKKFGARIEKVNEKGSKKWYVYNDGQWGLIEDDEGFYASDDELIEMADDYASEYAKGGYMANGGITKEDLKEFKSYVKSYYGKGEIYEEFFPPIGASNDEIELAIRMYVSYCKTKEGQWGRGDTFDREFVRDVMLYNRGQKTNLEYQRAVKEIVKHYNNKSFEYGGILEPMIGGVNADPRFDIYNTTMFAKDGAELPKGEKMRRGGFVTTMDDLIASADLIGEAEAKMKEGDFDQVLNFAYTDYGGDFFDKVAIEFFLENYPDNIVVENTMYSGKNAIVFGEPAREFAEASERYILGFDNIEDYYYQMQYEQEREDFERFLDDMEKYNNYKVSKEALDWLLENKSGYYSILPSGLDYSESDLEEELVNEGLLEKNEEMAKGGKTHEQGYDDREDESLAMRHGKISSKDFVGSHHKKEHSRRDDARFETRDK
jgi:hypothetical protein